jgi:hypothetical protein
VLALAARRERRGDLVREAVMMGRNEPCPCGSGRKYKHCHLDAERDRLRAAAPQVESMFYDLPSVHMSAATRRPGFAGEVTAAADTLNAAFRREIGNGLEGRDAAEALARYMERVEATMAEIATGHSRGYWMHLSRRLPPSPLCAASHWTVLLYRRVLTLAVIKHGLPRVLDGEFASIETPVGSQYVPAELDHERIVEAFALEYLAFEYTSASQTYRRVGKGARLVVVDDDFAATAGDELEELIQDVDRRVTRHGELAGMYGAAADREFPVELPEGSLGPLAAVAMIPNSYRVPAAKAMRSKGVRVPGPTNFLAVPVVIDGYREALAPLASRRGAAPEHRLPRVPAWRGLGSADPRGVPLGELPD